MSALGHNPTFAGTRVSAHVSARCAQAAGALTGLPRELRAEYMAGDAKKKAAAGGHGSPWNTYYHAARF